jgi:hypothetical protein
MGEFKMRIKIVSTFLVAVAFLMLFGFSSASAQPTEAQIRKDISGPRTVSITFGKPGTRTWSSTYTKYIWTRTFTAKLTTEEKGVFVIVDGYAAYDIFGSKFTFWRTFTSSNSYEGIPNPTANDVQALIKKFGLEKFMGNYHYGNRVGDVESIGLSTEPKFEWHTMKSVSFNVDATYTEKTNGIGGKMRGVRTFRIRLYADAPKGEWKNMISSSPNQMKEL